jgi:hypothetical protein
LSAADSGGQRLHCAVTDHRGIGCGTQRERQDATDNPTRDKQDRCSNAQAQWEKISIKRMRHFCGGSIFHNLISFLVSGFFDSFLVLISGHSPVPSENFTPRYKEKCGDFTFLDRRGNALL